MLRSLNSGVSAMQQFQQGLDVIGNNVANVNTISYKGARVDFSDALSQTVSSQGGGMPMQVGTGVGTSAISNKFTQGTFNRTDVPTDLAIKDGGFFVLRDTVTNSEYVTRDGSFKMEGNNLVSSGGMRVQGFIDSALTTRGDIVIDPGDVQTQRIATATTGLATANTNLTAAQTALAADPTNTTLQDAVTAAQTALTTAQSALTAAQTLSVTSFNVDNMGKINVRLNDGTEYVRGQVLLQNFQNPQALNKEGSNLYSATTMAGGLSQATAPGTSGLGKIISGNLEMSNVDLANEFASLITTQRAFQASAKIITTSDEILQDLVNLKR